MMNEGRRTQVVLLDERRLDIVVQPRLQTTELLNIVASHCSLKEPDKAYFGLAFVDEKQQHHWLQTERRALDHDFPKKYSVPGATLVLFHMVKFFVDSVTQLTHPSTVELFFLQAKQTVQRGLVDVSEEDMCQLGAYLLQIVFGDYTGDFIGRTHLKQVLIVPQRFLKLHGAFLNECEDQILEIYKQLVGMSRGAAVLGYMQVVERLPTFGMHFYEVKDKVGVPWCLGISSKGIFQFELTERHKARRVFQWKQLENLYYRDKKFSIEIHDPKRVVHTLSSFNLYEDAICEPADLSDDLTAAVCDPTTQVSVSRRAFIPSNVHVHVFFCESAQLCKIVWSIAIAQHQFYLDRKVSAKKSSGNLQKKSVDSMAEKLSQWLESTTSLESAFSNTNKSTSDLGSSVSSQSLPSLQSTTSSEKSEDERAKDVQMYKALQEKKRLMEKILEEKLLELKEICRKEGDITGDLPKEVYRALKPGEQPPKVRRRQKTDFSISEEIVLKSANKADKLAQLEAQVEIKRKIVGGYSKLASDRTLNKSVKKKMQKDYEMERLKLKQLEHQLHQLRISSSKPDLPSSLSDDRAWPNFYGLPQSVIACTSPSKLLQMAKSAPNTPRGSVPDLSMEADEEEPPFLPSQSQQPRSGFQLPVTTTSGQQSFRHPNLIAGTSAYYSSSVPPSPVHHANNGQVISSVDMDNLSLDSVIPTSASAASLPIYENVGYKTSSSYQSSYRRRHYPTLTGPDTNRLSHNHRTHSEHSLQSLPSSSPLEPLPDYKTAGGEALDHEVGAYNIPHQGSSINYVTPVDKSGRSVELTKPYDSKDVLKYSHRAHHHQNDMGAPAMRRASTDSNPLLNSPGSLSPVSPQMTRNPTSFPNSTGCVMTGVFSVAPAPNRPPPPPYTSPRRTLPMQQNSNSNREEERLAWQDRDTRKPKTATIV